nr:unnamed protein product [Callosobruchus analis]
MFLNTLNVSETAVRTFLAKKQTTGIVEKEKRGGLSQILQSKDLEIKNAIQRFPRMKSHYCRQSSCREQLHPHFNLTKMFYIVFEEYSSCNIPTIYQTYGKVFRKLNLSFRRPKKDVCGLYVAFRESDNEKKEEEYTCHIKKKVKVRRKKQ